MSTASSSSSAAAVAGASVATKTFSGVLSCGVGKIQVVAVF